jgi:hypothetical protein
MDPLTSVLAFFFFGFLAIVLLVIAAKTIRIVPQATVMLVERLGRFDKIASSGLNLLVPFLDRPRAVYWTNTRPGVTSIDLREQYLDLPPQPVITRDNVTIHVDSVVYWQITDPVKAVYEMNDLVGGIVQLTITGMRAVMGDMDLDHTLSRKAGGSNTRGRRKTISDSRCRRRGRGATTKCQGRSGSNCTGRRSDARARQSRGVFDYHPLHREPARYDAHKQFQSHLHAGGNFGDAVSCRGDKGSAVANRSVQR